MASKESAVVLPLLVASYDWLFSGEGMAGLRRRRGFYGCMLATWIVLVAVILSQAGRYGEFQKTAHDPFAYLLTQPRVILHYLRLAAFPSPLCFDYIWRTVETWSEFLPSLVYVLALAALTGAGMVRRRPWAWLGIAFFLTLAPTSSIMPVVAVAAEHRMYLPLAACVAAVVLGCDWLVQRRIKRQPGSARSLGFAAIVAAGLWIAILVVMTRSRNEVYATPGGIWMDVLAKQPTSTRALWNLAATCIELGDLDAALRFADESAALNPRIPVYLDLAEQLRNSGDCLAAVQILRHGLEHVGPALGSADPAVKAMEEVLERCLHEHETTAQ
jgi:tetratricopeptide (TPR) repeat protein